MLVWTGTYAGFVVDGLGASVVADTPAVVAVDGTVEVRNVPAGATCLLSGLRVTADQEHDGLVVADNPGYVRIQECVVAGGAGLLDCTDDSHGGRGVFVRNSPAVGFVGSELTGGLGGGFDVCTTFGGDGGHALDAEDSSIALYDCTLRGGRGGEADFYRNNFGGRGGDGARVRTWGVFASKTSFHGGDGGHGWQGGDGGGGLHVLGAAQARLVEVTAAGGFGGWSSDGDGADGQDFAGAGIFHFLPPVGRRLDAPVLTCDASTWQVRVLGLPGDRVLLASSTVQDHRFRPTLCGLWFLEARDFATPVEVGTIGATGVLVIPLAVPDLPPNTPALLETFQALVVDPTREAVLTSPAHRVTLDCP